MLNKYKNFLDNFFTIKFNNSMKDIHISMCSFFCVYLFHCHSNKRYLKGKKNESMFLQVIFPCNYTYTRPYTLACNN